MKTRQRSVMRPLPREEHEKLSEEISGSAVFILYTASAGSSVFP
jgi:hypothetical protein